MFCIFNYYNFLSRAPLDNSLVAEWATLAK